MLIDSSTCQPRGAAVWSDVVGCTGADSALPSFKFSKYSRRCQTYAANSTDTPYSPHSTYKVQMQDRQTEFAGGWRGFCKNEGTLRVCHTPHHPHTGRPAGKGTRVRLT